MLWMHSRVSIVHTQHTTPPLRYLQPPLHTPLTKTLWAFLHSTLHPSSLLTTPSPHTPLQRHPKRSHTAHDTPLRYLQPPLHTPFTKITWAFTHSSRHPSSLLTTPSPHTLYKDTLGVHTQHTTPPLRYLQPPSHTFFPKAPWAFTEDVREADILRGCTAGCPTHVQQTTPSFHFLHPPPHTPFKHTLAARTEGCDTGEHCAFLRLLKARRFVRVLYCHSHIFEISLALYLKSLFLI
jgi:hypothetical protein